jgi:hypothetical protein
MNQQDRKVCYIHLCTSEKASVADIAVGAAEQHYNGSDEDFAQYLAAIFVKIISLLQKCTELFKFSVLQETEKGGGIFLGTA